MKRIKKNKIWQTGNDAKNIVISEYHFKEIMTQFPEYKTNATQAKLLLVLSTVFARYSSSYIFGTDRDSPPPLRNYALALLNKAVLLDETIVDKAKLDKWQNKFTGSNRAFSCTASLSDGMKQFIIEREDNDLIDILKKFYPLNW